MRYLGKDRPRDWRWSSRRRCTGRAGKLGFEGWHHGAGHRSTAGLLTRRFRRARQSCAARKQYLEALLELSPAAVVTTDLEHMCPAVWMRQAPDALPGTPRAKQWDATSTICREDQTSCTQRPSTSTSGSPMVRSGSSLGVCARTEHSQTSTSEPPPSLVGGEMVGTYAITTT